MTSIILISIILSIAAALGLKKVPPKKREDVAVTFSIITFFVCIGFLFSDKDLGQSLSMLLPIPCVAISSFLMFKVGQKTIKKAKDKSYRNDIYNALQMASDPYDKKFFNEYLTEESTLLVGNITISPSSDEDNWAFLSTKKDNVEITIELEPDEIKVTLNDSMEETKEDITISYLDLENEKYKLIKDILEEVGSALQLKINDYNNTKNKNKPGDLLKSVTEKTVNKTSEEKLNKALEAMGIDDPELMLNSYYLYAKKT